MTSENLVRLDVFFAVRLTVNHVPFCSTVGVEFPSDQDKIKNSSRLYKFEGKNTNTYVHSLSHESTQRFMHLAPGLTAGETI